MTTANTIIAIRYEWIKLIPIYFCQIGKEYFLVCHTIWVVSLWVLWDEKGWKSLPWRKIQGFIFNYFHREFFSLSIKHLLLLCLGFPSFHSPLKGLRTQFFNRLQSILGRWYAGDLASTFIISLKARADVVELHGWANCPLLLRIYISLLKATQDKSACQIEDG